MVNSIRTAATPACAMTARGSVLRTSALQPARYYSSLNEDTDMSNIPFSPIIGSKHCTASTTLIGRVYFLMSVYLLRGL